METELQKNLLNQALAHRQAGRQEELRHICREVLRRRPECADAWYLLGLSAWDQGDAPEAQAHLSRAITLDGHNPGYLNAMGIVLIEKRQLRQAEAMLRAALERHPGNTDLGCNLGRALMLQEFFDEALSCFAQVLKNHPEHAVSLFNRAVVFQSLGQLREALDNYQRALRIEPQRASWWANLGAAQNALADYAAAVTAFRNALALAPDHPVATRGLAMACCALEQYSEAGRLLLRWLSSHPEDEEATATLAIVYQHTGQWEALRQVLPRLARQTEAALGRNVVPAEQPLFNISWADDPALNLKVARAWSRSIAQRARAAKAPFAHAPGRRPTDDRITIGYLSADFRSHAVAHQAVALFELHDRSKYRVCGFSVGSYPEDDYRRRISAACDLFVDLSKADAREAARKIHDCGVDILVDLMGHTHQNRLDICALRPAPLQVSYLGFLSSSGADYIDYLVGDPVVTPPEHDSYYSEKIIRLPHCYQIVSPTVPSPPAVSHRQAQLPEGAFVFCCFNQAYKIEADIFGRWMEILRAMPSAVLWLRRSNDAAMANLLAAAADRGIRPERLIFADKLPLADHLNRLRQADLALDTPVYNGGATTANALVAGVPLITTLGNHFVSRMSASHLKVLGLGALVADDLNHYVRLAVSLAQSPPRLHALRQALGLAAAVSPLFDASRFVRDLEKAYDAIWSRYRQGQPPEHLEI